MSFHPNTTVYLCAGTGIDSANSIWWHRFAYPSSSVPNDNSWWTTCFQWFKAHSIAEGNWYCTYLDPTRGYFQVGRMPLNDKSIPMGEEGLGSSEQQRLIDDERIPFAECLRGVDYICFANDGQSGGISDVQYAFVTRIEHVNYNTARVYFTIDAIMTYQKYFFLGKCRVERDMQYAERVTELGVPNPQQINLKPEPIEPEDSQYVFQTFSPNTFGAVQELNLGKYNRLFVTSDVDLSDPNMISTNQYYGGLPAFKPAPSTQLGTVGEQNLTELGLGLYYVKNRVNPVFDKLGSFNAMEHILFSYAVPQELAPNIPDVDIAFINNAFAVLNPKFAEGASPLELLIPSKINDDNEVIGSSGFQPINLKTLHAPYCYVSIADKQGGSVEIIPQMLGVNSTHDESFVYKLLINLRATIAPNTASILYIDDYKGRLGRRDFPLFTAWQIPSYTMTPNNSGWRLTQIHASSYAELGITQIAIGGAIIAGMAALVVGTGGLGAIAAGGLGGLLGASIPLKGGISAASLTAHVAGGIAGAGGGSISNAIATKKAANIQRIYGLPKASGGLSDGYTFDTIQSAKYVPYYVHLRTDILKEIDTLFSVYGYTQNVFRFPHINIRKRWCYVQLENVNIIGLGANNYVKGGVPFEMRQQIEERLQAGVTFWNVRHAIMGDGDTGASDVTSYTDGRIQGCIHQKFVRNYGASANSDIMKENASWLGSYASDYSDDVNEADII